MSTETLTNPLTIDTAIDQQGQQLTAAFTDGQPVVAINNEFGLKDLEKFQPTRRNYRASYNTISLSSFADYCRTEAAEVDSDENKVLCFVDPEQGHANTVFDLGTPDNPLHGDWTASLKLRKSPELRAFYEITGQGRTPQRQLAEWLEEWSSVLVYHSETGEEIPAATAVAAVRGVTVKNRKELESTTSNFAGTRSSLEQVEVSSRAGSLPSFVTVRAAPYSNFQVRDFTARISISERDDAFSFSLKPQRLESLLEHIADEFAAHLRDGMDDAPVRVCIGSISY